jgi:hypothetical protein
MLCPNFRNFGLKLLKALWGALVGNNWFKYY